MFPFEFGNISISVYDNCSARFFVFMIILQAVEVLEYILWILVQFFRIFPFLENDVCSYFWCALNRRWLGLCIAINSLLWIRQCIKNGIAFDCHQFMVCGTKLQKQFATNSPIWWACSLLWRSQYNEYKLNLPDRPKKSISFGEMETMPRIRAHTHFILFGGRVCFDFSIWIRYDYQTKSQRKICSSPANKSYLHTRWNHMKITKLKP